MKTLIKILITLIFYLSFFLQIAQSSDKIRIGLIVPLSGEYSYIGNSIIIASGLYIVMREMKLKKNIVTSTARHPTIPIKKD